MALPITELQSMIEGVVTAIKGAHCALQRDRVARLDFQSTEFEISADIVSKDGLNRIERVQVTKSEPQTNTKTTPGHTTTQQRAATTSEIREDLHVTTTIEVNEAEKSTTKDTTTGNGMELAVQIQNGGDTIDEEYEVKST